MVKNKVISNGNWWKPLMFGATMVVSQNILAAEACVNLTQTTDVAGHSCCILPPPEKLNVEMEASEISFSSDSQISWLPLSGSLAENGAINMQGTSTVAGFPDVTTTFSGEKSGDVIKGSFTVGAKGKLPEGQPIIYDVTIDTACGVSSACVGTYRDAGMEIVIESDLTGTVNTGDLEGKIFAVHEYETPGNVCFLSAFVSSKLESCDLVVAGRLEVSSDKGNEQGEFEFGGGNSCHGEIGPFTLNLPKIK